MTAVQSAANDQHPADQQMPETIIPSITFETITFSDGTTIHLNPKDIIVFVGPNNAGKSEALRELSQHLFPQRTGVVVKSVKLRKTGNVEQLRAFLNLHAKKKDIQYQGYRINVDDRTLDRAWTHDIGPLQNLFCQQISTQSRIQDSNHASAINTIEHAPSHPIHMLFDDDKIEQRISDYFRRAFGKDLIVFRAGGNTWPLLVGERLVAQPGEHMYSKSYNERQLDAAVQLSLQGDGMRSFATVILHMLAPATPSILLLDEPEAFLHPPQARLLGEFIANERPPQAQLFISTHSPDVLQGLLSTASQHLRIIRIQRDGDVNRVKELDKEKTRRIAADPLMKFSSVMSGVFHQRVIICESDSDCMFYSSILDLPDVRGERQPDVLFIHAGGKQRMAALAESLCALGVNVDVIADIDILNDETILQNLITTLGGNWSEILAEARPLRLAIEQKKPWLDAGEVVKEIQKILRGVSTSGEFPKKLRSDVDAVFRKASPWEAIKAAGAAAIPPGQATQQYQRLQNLCKECGLWIVPVGELEGFCKSEGGHGPQWVQKIIESRDLAADGELAAARDFMSELYNKRPS